MRTKEGCVTKLDAYILIIFLHMSPEQVHNRPNSHEISPPLIEGSIQFTQKPATEFNLQGIETYHPTMCYIPKIQFNMAHFSNLSLCIDHFRFSDSSFQ
jgi:hypothetical protein